MSSRRFGDGDENITLCLTGPVIRAPYAAESKVVRRGEKFAEEDRLPLPRAFPVKCVGLTPCYRVVYVLAAGIRKEGDKKDIYQIVKKLLRAGLLDLDEA